MFDFLFDNASRGLQKIRDNPQLFYTVGIAVLIVGAFVIMSERFIGIANDSQERLINVRVGSLQDAFVSFASDKITEPDYLNKKILEAIRGNETIKNFRVIQRQVLGPASSQDEEKFLIISSNDQSEIGQYDNENGFLFTLASIDPSNSITVQVNEGEERLFKTARAIMDSYGNVVGAIVTTQTLSMADLVIEKNIRNSLLLLVAILALIIVLFFRHSKIIDYAFLYKRLKEVDQMKDDFISMASHELRAPLSIIRGYTEFITEAPELKSETKDYANKIETSAKNLDLLVADILDVSRIEQGRMSFSLEKINPKNLIDEIVNSFKETSREKGIGLTFDSSLSNENQLINADKERLRQVIVNLISNAIKYTKKGEVQVRQYSENGRLYIRVSDTGIGMSAEEKEKLFEKFYRIKSDETKDVRGTGLGLWITEKIIKEMKGGISVESIKGVGSHFIVYFPLTR